MLLEMCCLCLLPTSCLILNPCCPWHTSLQTGSLSSLSDSLWPEGGAVSLFCLRSQHNLYSACISNSFFLQFCLVSFHHGSEMRVLLKDNVLWLFSLSCHLYFSNLCKKFLLFLKFCTPQNVERSRWDSQGSSVSAVYTETDQASPNVTQHQQYVRWASDNTFQERWKLITVLPDPEDAQKSFPITQNCFGSTHRHAVTGWS